MQAVLAYLEKVDPGAGAPGARRYACFDRFGDELQDYARRGRLRPRPYRASAKSSRSCSTCTAARLDYASRDGRVAPDEFFFAEQNARLVRNAEEYYRTMFRGRAESWNLRDAHMAETLRRAARVSRPHASADARVVVWAHNSHLGRCARHRDGRGAAS